MQNNVALFGGAFDPFHNGHQYIINQLKLLNFKKIILIPTGVSAFNKNLTEARHRINMINAATKDIEVSNYEVNRSDQITFSIDTIKYYLKTYPQLILVIGEDCFYSFDRWKDWKKIIDLIKSNDAKAFNQIRQIVADSNIRDYNELYRALFENLDSFHNPVLGTIIIAESQYQSVMAPDKEITFMGCIANLLKPF